MDAWINLEHLRQILTWKSIDCPGSFLKQHVEVSCYSNLLSEICSTIYWVVCMAKPKPSDHNTTRMNNLWPSLAIRGWLRSLALLLTKTQIKSPLFGDKTTGGTFSWNSNCQADSSAIERFSQDLGSAIACILGVCQTKRNPYVLCQILIWWKLGYNKESKRISKREKQNFKNWQQIKCVAPLECFYYQTDGHAIGVICDFHITHQNM